MLLDVLECPHIEGPPTRISALLQVGLTFTMDGPAPEPGRSINGGQELPSKDSWVRLFWLTSLKFFHGYTGLPLLLAVDPTSCPRSLHGCVGSGLTVIPRNDWGPCTTVLPAALFTSPQHAESSKEKKKERKKAAPLLLGSISFSSAIPSLSFPRLLTSLPMSRNGL